MNYVQQDDGGMDVGMDGEVVEELMEDPGQ